MIQFLLLHPFHSIYRCLAQPSRALGTDVHTKHERTRAPTPSLCKFPIIQWMAYACLSTKTYELRRDTIWKVFVKICGKRKKQTKKNSHTIYDSCTFTNRLTTNGQPLLVLGLAISRFLVFTNLKKKRKEKKSNQSPQSVRFQACSSRSPGEVCCRGDLM